MFPIKKSFQTSVPSTGRVDLIDKIAKSGTTGHMANKRKQLLELEEDQKPLLAFTECNDVEMRTKIQAVRFYGNNVPVAEITNLTGLPRRTINCWYSRYLRLDLSGFVDNRQGGNSTYLTAEKIQDLAEKLNQYRPVDLLGLEKVATAEGLHWIVPDLRQAVKQWYGVEYKTAASYHRLFRKCDFSYQRPAKVFRSRSEKKVAEFEEMKVLVRTAIDSYWKNSVKVTLSDRIDG